MKKLRILNTICFAVLILFFSQAVVTADEPADYVDLFLGTSSSRWMLYPGPSMPFGMIKLSPDNTDEWAMNAGYEYSIESISGFGHVHSWMMGSFLTMPVTGPLKIQPGLESDPDAGYRSRINHEQETASPGYYAVYLDDYAIRAELTVTTRSGFQRYTYPESNESRIVFDLNIPEEGRPTILDASVNIVNQNEISGYVQRSAGWNEYTLYFVARFNKPFKSMDGWKGTTIYNNVSEISTEENEDIGAVINYSTKSGEIILLKTAISYVSVEQARLNLEKETASFGWDFDLAHRQARQVWNDLLERIQVAGGTESDKIKFYTNFYRSYNARTIFSDVNGKYTDMCEIVQQLEDPDSPVYGCDAFWNTFWNLNQLWTMLTPDIANKWVKSLLEIYDRGGWLSKGPAGIEYSSIMVASHEIPLIVSAYQKGIRNYDVAKAYEAIKKIQMEPGKPHDCGGYVGNRNLKSYMTMGYVPADEGSVSNTLEYAYDDWCVAQMAKALGNKQDYNYFMKRSQYYKNVFDKTSGYVRPKYEGGPWLEEFQPVIGAVGKEDAFGTKHYVEGNAWQFTWFVPHDLPGLLELMGITEFNNRLEQGFEEARPNFVSEYVNHSNQPNMQAAYLFNYAGQPWQTQKWVKEIMEHYYGLGPVDGYPGDEDQGQMGAWYVMSALGLFQMDGGASVKPIYEIGSPVFERATIMLDNAYYPGKQFIIEAKNLSKKNVYIQSATLNGKPLNDFWFYHSVLASGGKLVLEMGPEPNKQWATDSMVPADNDFELIVTTPYLTNETKSFIDDIDISLACDTKGAKIYYTLDGSEPSNTSSRYDGPIRINRTTTLKMRAYVDANASLVASALVNKAESQPEIPPDLLGQGILYNYYTGFYRDVHDFKDSKPVKSGVTDLFSTQLRDREQFFAFEFRGYIKIPQDGQYTFYLVSNDGSRMFWGDRILINNDGLHPAAEMSRSLVLTQGLYPYMIKYFQEGATHYFKVEWKGPGFERQPVPAELLFYLKNE